MSRDARRAGAGAAARHPRTRADRAFLAAHPRHPYPAAPRHAQHAAHLSPAADRARRLRAARRRRNAKLARGRAADFRRQFRSEEHTSELQSLMRISYAVFCLKKKKKHEIYSSVRRKIE